MAKKPQKPKARNYVAKHSFQKSGAGQHVEKTGGKAPRVRQKRQWKKEAGMLEDMNAATRDVDPFDQAIVDIEQEFNINLSEGFSTQQNADMDKLIGHYGKSFFRDDTAEQVGNDLEMLEYSPEEVESMVPHIMSNVERMWKDQSK